RRRKVIAFDLYGTLLSTDSIAHELAKHYGEEAAPGIATLWRRFQLEYTWRITRMGEFKNFQEITRSALGHALMEHSGIKLTAKAASELMRAYDSLHVSSRSSASSSSSSSLPEIDAYIFTNGTSEMAMRSMVTSPELWLHTKASKRGLFSDPGSIVSADSVQCYKPDPRVYQHLLDVAGVRTEQDKRNVWVISANPFDVVGAKAAGLRAAWIHRAGKGWVDRLDEMRVPSVTATGVDEAIKAILSWN
ncbi:HAD-like domain-containing protein, partial [Microdochium trichocladiopsis]